MDIRNEEESGESKGKRNGAIIVDLEYSKEWSLRNSPPILRHMVSEFQDFVKSENAVKEPFSNGHDVIGNLDESNPPRTGTTSPRGDSFDEEIEPDCEEQKTHGKGVIRQR
ncbi:MAG: hypothetical protein ACE5IO_07940 [Thermoplasmata archaeon]